MGKLRPTTKLKLTLEGRSVPGRFDDGGLVPLNWPGRVSPGPRYNYPGTTVYCKGTGQVAEAVIGDSQAQQDTDDWDDMAMCQDYWDSWMMGRWSATVTPVRSRRAG